MPSTCSSDHDGGERRNKREAHCNILFCARSRETGLTERLTEREQSEQLLANSNRDDESVVLRLVHLSVVCMCSMCVERARAHRPVF